MKGALFKMDALRNPVVNKLKDGDKVQVLGDVSVYPKGGSFQIIAKKLTLAGVGDLKFQLEQLKKKLASEGLFDAAIKKKIPSLPKRVAIITALRGAALQDFLSVYKRRSVWMDIVVVPALVQGDQAPASIRKALFNVIQYSQNSTEENRIEVVILARGGGSLEDLWAFNDEALAWEIYQCPIPVISAVGHEVDYSISDYVADFRAETPTAAAEYLTQSQTQLRERVSNAGRHLRKDLEYLLSPFKQKLQYQNPQRLLEIIFQKIVNYQRRLNRCDLKKRVAEFFPVRQQQMHLDNLIEKIKANLSLKLSKLNDRNQRGNELLKVLDPGHVLGRGFTYLKNEQGHIVSSVKDFDRSERWDLVFKDGSRKVKKV